MSLANLPYAAWKESKTLKELVKQVNKDLKEKRVLNQLEDEIQSDKGNL